MKIKLKIFIIVFWIFLFSSNSFAQLKAYSDTSRIKDAITHDIFTVPEISAEFPGGTQKMFKYLMDKFTSKVVISKEDLADFRSPIVRWTVDETGKVTDAKIVKSSNIISVDNLLKDTVSKMPLWKPAENDNKKVKQVFTIPLHICFK